MKPPYGNPISVESREDRYWSSAFQLRRLYSTFAGGLPGAGLVLLRLVVGVILVNNERSVLLRTPAIPLIILSVLLGGAAIFLIIGLYTPVVGSVVAFIEGCRLVAIPTDWGAYLLVATLAAALAMLGPGLWSVDARLFGWKRIEPSPRKR